MLRSLISAIWYRIATPLLYKIKGKKYLKNIKISFYIIFSSKSLINVLHTRYFTAIAFETALNFISIDSLSPHEFILLVLASKSRTLSLTKQNKTNAILKTLYVKKVEQIWRIVANKLSYKYENYFTSWVKQINTTIRPKIAC